MNDGPQLKLFVGCLPYSKNENDLTNLFKVYGPVTEVTLMKHPDGKSKGAAFVSMISQQVATFAQQSLDGYKFPNTPRAICVSFATNNKGASIFNDNRGKGSDRISYGHPYGQVSPGRYDMNDNGMGSFMNQPPRESWMQSEFNTGGFHPGGGYGYAHQPSPFMQHQPPPPAPNGPPNQFNGGNYRPSRDQMIKSNVPHPGAVKLFVGCLPFSKNEEHLYGLFGQVGEVIDCHMLRNRETGRKTGGAFIVYGNQQEAHEAVKQFNGHIFEGSPRPITVSIANKRD